MIRPHSYPHPITAITILCYSSVVVDDGSFRARVGSPCGHRTFPIFPQNSQCISDDRQQTSSVPKLLCYITYCSVSAGDSETFRQVGRAASSIFLDERKMIHDDGDESLLVLAQLKLNENTSSHVQPASLVQSKMECQITITRASPDGRAWPGLGGRQTNRLPIHRAN